MFDHVINVDMTQEQQLISVPYLILQGEEDLITSISYNQFLAKSNEHIERKIFQNAGHIPTNKSYEEMFSATYGFTDKIIAELLF